MADEKIFANGFSFKRKENAPDFVIGRLSMKVDDAVAFMTANAKRGWVNIDIKQARGGNYYMELDTFESQGGGSPQPATPASNEPEDDGKGLPF